MPTITGLSEAVSANDADLLPVVQGGETKQISADKISGLKALGINQNWVNVLGERSPTGVVYTNNTDKPMFVIVGTAYGTSGDIYIDIDGSTKYVLQDAGADTNQHTTFIVPPGSTYAVNKVSGVGVFTSWWELR